MPKPTKTFTATAYHETGHAVIGYLEGLMIQEVSIIPDGDTLGLCRYVHLRRFNPEIPITPVIRERLEAHILSSLARSRSRAALSRPHYDHTGAQTDRDTAVSLASYVTESAEEANAYLNWLTVRTRARLTTFWPLIESLADALVKQSRLTGAEVKDILTQIPK